VFETVKKHYFFDTLTLNESDVGTLCQNVLWRNAKENTLGELAKE
jgi:hypothetical protein